MRLLEIESEVLTVSVSVALAVVTVSLGDTRCSVVVSNVAVKDGDPIETVALGSSETLRLGLQ